MSAKILVYGSYGYTGDLIARFAKEDGVDIVLSGRNPHRLREQAEAHGFDSIAADLTDPQSIRNALRDVDVVIHCAGPFARTYEAMAKACMETQTHYTDITGEAEVFEGLWAMDGAAKNAGVMLLPGTGFDVVPSDCLAAHLKSRCPDATHLELAFRGRGGGVSHGTATTMAENIHRGGIVRQDGRLTRVATAWKTREIDFGDGKPAHCMTIPLGDVVTAYKSTGIPNILVYTAVPERAARLL
ncbi:MAG: saccharopine dehydrogenase NADP-binding domain-containing protein, partial [Myxococcales bacterium]|nr:saccharopine dehydrogenase NADP-binding domain-containing protein [Myxococcales bacterium]